jgi:hypothetical protein
MTLTTQIIDQLQDTKVIGRAIIGFITSVLSIVLTIISGTSNVTSAEDAVNLRNISIGFGATVAILNILLALIIDIMISACSSNAIDEATLDKLFKSDPVSSPDGSIVESTQMILSIVNQLKIASNNLGPNNTNNQAEFTLQLKKLEDAVNILGTDTSVIV